MQVFFKGVKMIYNLAGVPGSGKSLYMVSKIIAELLKLRDIFGNLTPTHIYHNIEGFSNDNMAALLEIDPSIVNSYVHAFKDEVPENSDVITSEQWAIRFFYAKPETVKPIYDLSGQVADYEYEVRQSGCVFIIDEAQNAFSSRDFKSAYSKTLIKYISRHRHYHHTIWWATQDSEQVDISFRRQTESVYYLENLSNWGNSKAAKISIYEGYIGHTVGVQPLITSKFRYDKRFYCCYKSFVKTAGALKEGRIANNVFVNSKGLKIVALLLVAVVIMLVVSGGPFKKIGDAGKKKPTTLAPSKGLAPVGALQNAKTLGGSGTENPEPPENVIQYTKQYRSDGVRWYVVDGLPQMENPNFTYERITERGNK